MPVFIKSWDQKPVHPRPEDFGLTRSQIESFQDPIAKAEDVIGYLGVCSGVIAGAYIFWAAKENILLGAVLGFLGGFLCFMVSVALASIAFYGIVRPIWRRSQPVYPQYRLYRAAKVAYHKTWQEWLWGQVSFWRTLSGREFEAGVGMLLKELGWNLRYVGGPGDEGVDWIICKEDSQIVVQCKAHSKPIGPSAVRDLYGTVTATRAVEGWLISTFGFTEAAKAYARGKSIRLKPISHLLQELKEKQCRSGRC